MTTFTTPRRAAILLAATVLAGCVAPQAAAPTGASRQMAAAAGAAVAAKPEIGTFGFDTTGQDMSISPGADFYAYANGGWDARTEIPADRSRYGAFDALRERAEENVRTIVEAVAAQDNPAGSEAQKVGDYFATFMDAAAIEANGLAPLQQEFDAIAALSGPSDLAAYAGRAVFEGRAAPVALYIYQDVKSPTDYAVYLNQAGLGLPDRDYYLDAKWEDTRAAYKAHMARMFSLAGFDDAETRAADVFALEEQIAQNHWTRVESRQAEKVYNPWVRSDFATEAKGFDWDAYFAAAGLPEHGRFVVRQPSAISGTAEVLGAADLAAVKNYLRYHLLVSAAPVLPKAFVEEAFAFYGKTLSGTPQLRDRWKRGLDLTESALGEAVGKLYVETYFPPEAKAKMDVLIANLVAAYRQRITNLEWMGPETREKALDKLAKFTPKIGYPAKWRDYSALEVVRGDAFGNWKRGAVFESRRQIARLGQPVDKDEWFMTPQTVNAYYNPPANEIVFPAAILQPPFFDLNADPAINYGAIGAVIGHEIGHGFDDQGSKYNGDGVLANWWTEEDRARFTQRTEALVAQYSAFEPLDGLPLNGALGLGENIGDLGGVEAAYTAYKLSLDGKEAPVIDGYSGDQRFFLGWAQVWRTLYRDEALRRQVTVGPHSPGQYRVLGVVRNMDAWYEAFGVAETDPLYLPPEQRVRIW